MKKQSLFVSIALTVIAGALLTGAFSCQPQPHVLSAEFQGMENDTVYLFYGRIADTRSDSDLATDTLVAARGRFVADIPVDAPTIVFLRFAAHRVADYSLQNGEVLLVVRPGEHVRLTGRVEATYTDYRVEGSTISRDHAALRPACRDAGTRYDSLYRLYLTWYESDRSPDGKAWNEDERDAYIETLGRQLNTAAADARRVQFDYVKSHLDRDISAYYLSRQPLDTFAHYSPQLSDSVRTGVFRPTLEAKQRSYEQYKRRQVNAAKVVAGAPAPDFTLADTSGAEVSLADFRGKYVVLDFWGSWCSWCIKGVPRMKEYYARYQSKVEFVGIACRDRDRDWRSAIARYGLHWTQLMNDEAGDIDRNVSVLYAINGYPTKIIIDPQQRIAAVVVGESDEFYQTLDKLLQ
jgi:peroxiredoxin